MGSSCSMELQNFKLCAPHRSKSADQASAGCGLALQVPGPAFEVTRLAASGCSNGCFNNTGRHQKV